MGIGGIDYLPLAIAPEDMRRSISVDYAYDDTVIALVDGDANGATISALQAGSTVLRASVSGLAAACAITVSGVAPSIANTPVITTVTPVVEVESGSMKRIMVSLTGGSAADMISFAWSIDKSAIASIDAVGQTAMVTGKTNGTARITVTHPSALYPLELLVFVKPDDIKPVYLTTTQNIIFLAQDSPDQNVSVSLVNGSETEDHLFSWQTLASEESSASVVSILANGPNAAISPREEGTAVVEISHPSALYPLHIRVRVVSVVANVFIEPSELKAVVSGSTTKTISAELRGAARNTLTSNQFAWQIDTMEFCDMTVFQDNILLSGKKDGSAKITISHPAAKYPREILVVVEGQTLIDTSMYITTSQNFIRAKEGAEDLELIVELVGGLPGDEADFRWSIGDPSVISMRTANGLVENGRAILSQRISGTAYIDALQEGTTTVAIAHPKIAIPTEVLVKVLPYYAVLEEPLYLKGPSLVGIVKGESKTVSLNLLGNIRGNDESLLAWSTENLGVASVAGNGLNGAITAVQSGEEYIIISHPRAENPKKILVYVAETAEQLAARQVLYTEKTYYNIVVGAQESLSLSSLNIEDTEIAGIAWSSGNAAIAAVAAGTTNMSGIVSGRSAGHALVTASLAGVRPVEFDITVYPEGTNLDIVPEPQYLTTSQNVVQLAAINSSKTVTVTPVKIPAVDHHRISWVIDNPAIADISANGAGAVVTAKSEGIARVAVSHPDSENSLAISIRVGNAYVSGEPSIPLIVTDQDTVRLGLNTQGTQIIARLENSPDTSGFSWSIDRSDIAAITPSGERCLIVPRAAGQAQITVTHANAAYDKKVLVLVDPETISSIKYLTTSQNLLYLTPGGQQTVSARLMSAGGTGESELSSAYAWSNDNPNAVQVISSGPQAALNGITTGVAHLTVSNTLCRYPLDITVIINTTLADASLNPYIAAPQNIITVAKGGSGKTVAVKLEGGDESDNIHFAWTIDRNTIASLTANGQNAVIKGLETGECRITVSHPKAGYAFPITVIVEEPAASSNLYISASQSIVTMKPADSEQTVTASLIGGSAEDKYGFSWYADNYNVVDVTYSSNMAVITPKQEGIARITITHPKAPYDGLITIRVTEYSNFSFAYPSLSIMEGTVQFVTMQVPAMEGEYSGRVIYATDNSKIVAVSGTNRTAQVTAVGSGTAIVSATSPSGAKSEMMVHVQKAAEATAPYISSTTNVISMKATDNERSINASLVGQNVEPTDQYNLIWTIENPSVARLIGSTGSSVLVKPVAGGETTIKISHQKTDSIYTIYVQVENVNTGISFDRTYLAIETGKNAELTASIDYGTSEDYKKILWTAAKAGSADVVSILGSGKTVAVYAVKAGRTTVSADFNGKIATCDVVVTSTRQFAFATQTLRIEPGQSKTVNYALVPDDSPITWLTNTDEYIAYSVDTANKRLTITGLSDGNNLNGSVTRLTGLANSLTSNLSITCVWDYSFSLNKTMINTEPRASSGDPDRFVIGYDVYPADATISVQMSRNIASYAVDAAAKKIILAPTAEGAATLSVSATNPKNGAAFATKACSLNFAYASLTPVMVINSQDGSYSRYDSGGSQLLLGDGEELSVKFSVAEPNVSYQISGVLFSKASSSSPSISLTHPSAEIWNIKHPEDYQELEYLVTKDVCYEYAGARLTFDWKQYKNGDTSFWYSPVSSTQSVVHAGNYLSVPWDNTGFMQSSFSILGPLFAYSRPDYFPEYILSPLEKNVSERISAAEYQSRYYIPAHGTTEFRVYDALSGNLKTSFPNPEIFLNPTASLVAVTDATVQKSALAGYVTGTIAHNGATQSFQIPVTVETRRCAK
jgi:hypothetical protein